MKTHKLQPILTLTILAVLVLTLLPTNSVFAATCTGSGCNGIDPKVQLVGTMQLLQIGLGGLMVR